MGIEWWSGGSEFESRMLLTYTDNYTDYFTAKLHRLKRAKKYKAKRGRDYPIYINKGNFFGNWAMRWEPVRRRRRRRRRRWKCLFLYPTAYYKCKQLRLKERKKERKTPSLFFLTFCLIGLKQIFLFNKHTPEKGSGTYSDKLDSSSISFKWVRLYIGRSINLLFYYWLFKNYITSTCDNNQE